MAQYDRKTFDKKITEKIVGALREFTKYKTAELNNQTKWVQHWKTEVDRLINIEFIDIYKSPIKGFKNKEKVLLEIINQFSDKANIKQYERYSKNVYKKYYKADPKKLITEKEIQEFLNNILTSVE